MDSEEGYLLLVHDPRFTPRMILPKDGLLVAPGVTMSLRLTLRIVSILYSFLDSLMIAEISFPLNPYKKKFS